MQPGEIDGSAIFEDPDAPLCALLAELEEADAQLRIAETIGQGVAARAEQHRAIRAKIEAFPAFGAEGLRAKARAADLAGRRDGLVGTAPGGFVALAASLVRDVLELGDVSETGVVFCPPTTV